MKLPGFAALIGVVAFLMVMRGSSSGWAQTPGAAHATPGVAVAPDEAMRRLRDGNARFVGQTATNAHRDAARRGELARAQRPFAVVLGCADSRVPPEVIFDQGLGDLFVVRVAGEVASPEVIGSIEYAAEHLGCRTVIVLGHQRCGAVEAAMDALAHGGATPEGDLGGLIREIEPSLEKIDRSKPDAMEEAVKADAVAVAGRLATRSKMLGGLVQTGEMVITPACYSLESGRVEFMAQVRAAKGEGKPSH